MSKQSAFDAALEGGSQSETPQISIVLPVFNGTEYLDACLNSIMRQSFDDIEVIAVNGGSTERTVWTILDGYAERDDRLRVLHLGKIGPGRARNEGMAMARGEYVWFVDADDLLPAGSLEDVADAVRHSRPDVLVLDFQYLSRRGKVSPSPSRDLLSRAPSGNYKLAEQPWLIDITMTSWSKVIHREFLRSIDLKFETGIHEDVPFTCTLLLDSSRIQVLNKVCYLYRQGRRGAFMTSTTDMHLDIFKSYARVLDDVEKRIANDDRSVSAAVRETLFKRAIMHYTTTLAKRGFGIGPLGFSGIVPRRLHREFFRRMRADFMRYRPPDLEYGSGPRAAKLRLIERDRYWTYSILEPTNKLRVWLTSAVPLRRRASGDGR